MPVRVCSGNLLSASSSVSCIKICSIKRVKMQPVYIDTVLYLAGQSNSFFNSV